MTSQVSTFLQRRECRTASKQLTQMLTLGFTIGFAALGVGSYKLLFVVPDVWDKLWGFVALFGGVSIVVTLVAPYAWLWPERILHRVGQWVGQSVLGAVLVLVYYAMIWPIGAVLRITKGTHPIYEWTDTVDSRMEGWRNKVLPSDVSNNKSALGFGKKSRLGIFQIMIFFVRRGHFFLIPVLLVLICIGITLFFLQTSALAPLIYTLF